MLLSPGCHPAAAPKSTPAHVWPKRDSPSSSQLVFRRPFAPSRCPSRTKLRMLTKAMLLFGYTRFQLLTPGATHVSMPAFVNGVISRSKLCEAPYDHATATISFGSERTRFG